MLNGIFCSPSCKDFVRRNVFSQGSIRLYILIATLILVTIPMMAVQVYIDVKTYHLKEGRDEHRRSLYNGTPLYDEILDNIPLVQKRFLGMTLNDFFLSSFILTSMIYFVIHPVVVSRNDRSLLIRRFLALLSIAYFLRIFTILFTRMPAAVPGCPIEDAKGWRYVERMVSASSACTDMIFSGHTSVTVFLLWSWLGNRGHILTKIYALAHSLVALSFFFLERLHYTVDIILAFYISSMLITIYSLCIRIIDRHDQNLDGDERKSFRFEEPFAVRIVRWIECRDGLGSAAGSRRELILSSGTDQDDMEMQRGKVEYNGNVVDLIKPLNEIKAA